MVAVTVVKSANGCYKGFESKGHAGFDAYGKDIICAAASVLIINTVNSIDTLTPTVVSVNASPDGGQLTAVFPEGLEEKAQVLLDAMVLGLMQIQDRYGKKYLSVKFKED